MRLYPLQPVLLFDSRSRPNAFAPSGTLTVDERRMVRVADAPPFSVLWRGGVAPPRAGAFRYTSRRDLEANEVRLETGEAFPNPSPLHRLMQRMHPDGSVAVRCTCKGYRIRGLRDSRPCAHRRGLEPHGKVVRLDDGARWMLCKDLRPQGTTA